MPQQKITTCLWFNDQGEEAAKFYTEIFPNSKIVGVTRYTEAGQEIHGKKPGAVMTAEFEVDGRHFTALNGGPLFKFTEAISFQVHCDTQEEIDYYWDWLGAGGDPKAQQCGWLKDRYGVSWQIVPSILPKLMEDPARAQRVIAALLGMGKLDIRALEAAAEGK